MYGDKPFYSMVEFGIAVIKNPFRRQNDSNQIYIKHFLSYVKKQFKSKVKIWIQNVKRSEYFWHLSQNVSQNWNVDSISEIGLSKCI